MSERELREELQRYRHPSENCDCPICCDIRELLADDPDVVKVLRLIERRAQQELDVMRNPALCDDVDRLSARASRTAYLAMAQWLRREFHVRLTETSWEWTE